MLLLRFGIRSRLTTIAPPRREDPPPGPDGEHAPGLQPPQFALDIAGRDDQLRFLREIGGGKATARNGLTAVLEGVSSIGMVETPSRQTWSRVRDILAQPELGPREIAASGTVRKQAPSRPRLARIASLLDEADLDLVATNDVFWDEIVSIEEIGDQDVYDATVLGLHNFIANGIASHNSIEQDADVVILLHRDDYYDKESPRAGEADFIVAKHRNGPTDTITVAAQLHFSRFVDMAIV
jgi:replicative DNA helicase